MTPFEALLARITSSPVFAITSFVITVVSIALAYLFYRRSRKNIQLQYWLVTHTLIENSAARFPRLQVLFDGKTLNDFGVAQLRIKNVGNTPIARGDVAPKKPIMLRAVDGATLLDCAVVYESHSAINAAVDKRADTEAYVSFDYVNTGDVFVVETIHTGTTEQSLRLSGAVIGESEPFSEEGARGTRAYKTFMFALFKYAFAPRYRLLRAVVDYLVGCGAHWRRLLATARAGLVRGSAVVGYMATLRGNTTPHEAPTVGNGAL